MLHSSSSEPQKQLEEKDELLAQLTKDSNYRLVSLDPRVADEAGRIRVATSLRFPDAILVALSLIEGAQIIVAYDIEFSKVRRLTHVLTAKHTLRRFESRRTRSNSGDSRRHKNLSIAAEEEA